MESKGLQGATGSCSSTGVFVQINVTNLLANPSQFSLQVHGKGAETTNTRISEGQLPECLPKIDNERNITTFNFTFAQCPSDPKKLNDSWIYDYTIALLVDKRDHYQDDPNSIFREHREFISIACEVEAHANAESDFVADVA